MPVDDATVGIFTSINTGLILKAFLILFLVFYTVFAFVLLRQIQLMGRSLPTPAVPFLKFLAIVHIGISLAILSIVIGTF